MDEKQTNLSGRNLNRYQHILVVGSFTFLTLALTWPLAINLTTHVPGIAQWAFDESTFLWNIWYLNHAVIENLSSPLHTELIWYPLGIDLVLYTYNIFHALVAQPLMMATNLPFASNLALIANTVLSAYGAFLLVRWLLGRAWAGSLGARLTSGEALLAAWGAGLVYAFASNRAVYAMLGHYDMVTTQWIPFYVLALLRSLDPDLSSARRRQAALWAGFFMALNGLAEMITALFLAIFTLIVLLIVLFSRRHRAVGAPWSHPLSMVTVMVLAGVAAFVVWSPILIPILFQFITDDFSLEGWGEAIPLSVDLLGFFTPTVLHPIFGDDVVAELRRVQLRALEQGVTGFRDVNTVFLGWTTALLALLAALYYRRKVKIWIWTTLIFGVFALGPFLQINGRYRFDLDGVDTTFPLPFALLHYLPIIQANRAPNRNSVLLMLGIAVLVGYALVWLLQTRSDRKRLVLTKRPQVWIAVLLCGLLLFEHLALPAPLSDARVPAVYEQIASDPRPVSVMHFPLGWRNSFGVFGPERTLLQYYQHVHNKPMLGGNISRAPAFKMDYFKRIPLFAVLEDIQFGREPNPAQIEQAQAQAEELMYLYDVGYVLFMPPIPERFPYADHWEDTWAFAKATLPLEDSPFWAQDGIEAYRVVQPVGSDRFTIDLGTPGSFPYRGEGWDEMEIETQGDDLVRLNIPSGGIGTWATDSISVLFVPLRNVDVNATYEAMIEVHPFVFPGAPEQRVTLRVNGVNQPSQLLVGQWQTLTWQLPGSALKNGLNRVELVWSYVAIPREVMGGSRAIGSTGVQLPVDADLTAFADGGYIALFDETGKQIDASTGRQGVNVTVLDQTTGAVLDKAGFDTTANHFEDEALVQYLKAIPPGRIVLVVSFGNASAHLSEMAVTELRHIGADVTVESLRDNHFAVIGVQGAPPGSAIGSVSEATAFARASLNRDRRNLAAAVRVLEITSEK